MVFAQSLAEIHTCLGSAVRTQKSKNNGGRDKGYNIKVWEVSNKKSWKIFPHKIKIHNFNVFSVFIGRKIMNKRNSIHMPEVWHECWWVKVSILTKEKIIFCCSFLKILVCFLKNEKKASTRAAISVINLGAVLIVE